eukprot:3037388-Alexandrium_andersonii.AAC.1
MRGDWQGARVCHKLLWQTREGYSTVPTGGEPARETVRYEPTRSSSCSRVSSPSGQRASSSTEAGPSA